VEAGVGSRPGLHHDRTRADLLLLGRGETHDRRETGRAAAQERVGRVTTIFTEFLPDESSLRRSLAPMSTTTTLDCVPVFDGRRCDPGDLGHGLERGLKDRLCRRILHRGLSRNRRDGQHQCGAQAREMSWRRRRGEKDMVQSLR